MSAFMVQDKTINRSVAVIVRITRSDCLFLKEKFNKLGYDLGTTEGREKLAYDMFELNISGVNNRYGNGEAKEFRELNFKYRFEINFSNIQGYKSLNCLTYQCMEGDNVEKPLFKLLEETEAVLAQYIVNRLPEYDNAEWA